MIDTNPLNGEGFYPQPVLEQASGPPMPVMWAAHTPDDVEHLLEDLDLWVSWLVGHYRLDHRHVPTCWPKHWELVEELSALRQAWDGAYCTTAHADAALTWHERFAHARTRLADWTARTGCRGTDHRPGLKQALPNAPISQFPQPQPG